MAQKSAVRDAIKDMAKGLSKVFKNYGRQARDKAWAKLISKKGKKEVEKLLINPKKPLNQFFKLAFKEWMLKNESFNRILPPKEDLYELIDASFNYGMLGGDETVDISTLKGGTNLHQPKERERVKQLAAQISSPNGYFERIVIDDQNNVIEGQHRLDALRELGIRQVPVTKILNMENVFNIQKMKEEFKRVANKPLYPDQIHGFIISALEAIQDSGSPQKALEQYEMPPQWQAAWEAALKAA